MNKTELRIGNMIRDIESGRVGTILTLGTKKCAVKMEFSKLMQDYDEFEPIPLSEEWLLKCGFQNTTPDGWLALNICNDWTFLFWQNGVLEISVNRHAVVLSKITSVHQLQNLVHSLRGEELTIKN